MPKGYWIGRIDVHDKDGYAPYVAAGPAIYEKFGGRFLVRAGEVVEGKGRARNVVIEFPDYETALVCYHSPEYQANRKHRLASADADLIIIEGFEGS